MNNWNDTGTLEQFSVQPAQQLISQSHAKMSTCANFVIVVADCSWYINPISNVRRNNQCLKQWKGLHIKTIASKNDVFNANRHVCYFSPHKRQSESCGHVLAERF